MGELKCNKEKNLRIGFGVHDFFSSQDNNRELLLPFSVLLGGLAVNLTNIPTKNRFRITIELKENKEGTHAHLYIH